MLLYGGAYKRNKDMSLDITIKNPNIIKSILSEDVVMNRHLNKVDEIVYLDDDIRLYKSYRFIANYNLTADRFAKLNKIINDSVPIDKVINFLEMSGQDLIIVDRINKSIYSNEQLIKDFKNYIR